MEANKQKILSLDPTYLLDIGGSGRKSLSVLTGETDICIYIGKKTKKWDTCSSEALLNCFNVAIEEEIIYIFLGTSIWTRPIDI